MALTAKFDYPNKIVSEPGIFRRYTGEDIATYSVGSQRNVWVDPLFNTIMLKPQQLDPNWLGTIQQHESIVRRADLFINAGDESALRVKENPYGSDDDPFIWHWPVAASGFFISAPMPGSPPSVTGVSVPSDLTSVIDPAIPPAEPNFDLTIHPHDLYEPSTAVPAAGSPPTPVRTGGYEDAKTIAVSNYMTEENQPYFFRWFHPAGPHPSKSNTLYVFSIGQFDLHIRDVVLQVYEDTSPHGDRTAGRKVLTYPLWGYQTDTETRRATTMNQTTPWNLTSHDRWLLWLPFRRNLVLVMSNMGRCHYLKTRPDTEIKRNADDTDWVNVRGDQLRVKTLTGSLGRFQIQRVKFPTNGKIDAPITRMDYDPASTPLITTYEDHDNSTAITTSYSSPPSYSIAAKPGDDCPVSPDPPTALYTRHGVQYTLTSSSPLHRYTPFLYGFDFESPRLLIDSPITATDITDTGTGSRLLEAKVSLGKEPGDGRAELSILDVSPYPLADRYDRSQVPVRILDGATNFFTGYSDPLERIPLTGQSGAPLRVTVPLVDGWKLLSVTSLTDPLDWTGAGHITAVLGTAKQAGVDTTGAETPPINTTVLDRRWNTKLFGTQAVASESGVQTAPWKVGPRETAASFILRIAMSFSGWDVGFRADGTFFYLPRDYDTTVGLTFYESQAAADAAAAPTAPLYRDPVVFKTVEPEANVIRVTAGKADKGGVTQSPLWIDWASIKNPAVVNFLGHWRYEEVIVKGGFTCSQLNTMARAIWMQTRRRFVTVEFDSIYRSDLKIGDLITLNNYGDWRITAIQSHFQRDTWHPATYSAVKDEKGYGLA